MAPRPVSAPLGDRFGNLVVVGLAPKEFPGQNPRWLCKCDCGEFSVHYAGNVRSGSARSCGCHLQGLLDAKRKERIVQDGYVFIHVPDHPRCAGKTNDLVREHIVVMEKHLGRYLLPEEEVHHRNAVRHDNRLENLELWTRSHPAGSRVTDKVEWATQLLRQYAPERLNTTQ